MPFRSLGFAIMTSMGLKWELNAVFHFNALIDNVPGLVRNVDWNATRHITQILPGSQIDIDADRFHASIGKQDQNHLVVRAIGFVVRLSGMWCISVAEKRGGSAPDPTITTP